MKWPNSCVRDRGRNIGVHNLYQILSFRWDHYCPGGESSGAATGTPRGFLLRIQQGVADRLRPGGLIHEVAGAACPESAERGERGAFRLGVRGQADDAAHRLPEEIQVNAEQAFGCLGAHRVGDGGALSSPWTT
jgi:hypothetical protein